MAELKTFVFTDIAGSVRLKDEMPGRNSFERDQAFVETILTPHRQRIEQHLEAHGGRVVSTAGDGHFLVFSDTILAARWATLLQESHRDDPLVSSHGTPIQVRISIHVGIPQIDPWDPNNFVGKSVDYAARLNDYATPGQILVSRSVVAILEDAGIEGVRFHSHGRRELKGIGRVEVHELVYEPSGPRPTRSAPKGQDTRQWTVLPTGMGQTATFAGGGVPATRSTATIRKLGNYELGELLGSGGMGDVYKAQHTQFGRVRAVKVIKQHFVEAGHEEIIRRFYREIRAVGRLEHPNVVVAIESSAPDDPVHFLVMEYIEGFSVEEFVAQCGALRLADACEIARQAAVGLEYIYQNHMVHRDIKPSNLMVTRGGADSGLGSVEGATPSESGGRAVVKILDLGLALLAADEGERFTRFDQRAMGTGMYMAPEQWRTTSVDIRADIYSLGCTLYHMLAGRPPFADSDLRPQRAHELAKLPKITRSDEPVPRGLWSILRTMTAKSPDDRYQSPLEVVQALEPYAKDHDLAALFAKHKQATAGAVTQVEGTSETHVSDGVRRDTLHERRTRPPLPARFEPRRRGPSWTGVIAGMLLVVVMAGWLIFGRQPDDRWQQNVTLTADFAARDIETEISNRINVLRQAVADPSLPRLIRRYEQARSSNDEQATDEAQRDLNTWINSQKLSHQADVPSESWFLVDDTGQQVARSPLSRKSLGENYAHRDYFHGQGRDFDPESLAERPPPLDEPHQSAVYESTSTGHLKMAFSAPVWDSRGGAPQEVVGVLGMSVDLNEFHVLEAKLLEGQQVVLLNLATDYVESPDGARGLVLHHPSAEEGHGRRAGEQLLGLIERALAEPPDDTGAVALPRFQDPAVTGGEPFRGAVCRVVDRKQIANAKATEWVVLVQEPAR